MFDFKRLAAACLLFAAACGGNQPASPAQPPAPAAKAVPVTPQVPPPLPGDLAGIVDRYRKIIVLHEDGRALEPADQQRADVAGRLLYQDKHERLTRLTDTLIADLQARPARLGNAEALLTALESHPDLRDADKLAVREVLEEILDATGATPPEPVRALRARFAEDAGDLARIQALYDKELKEIFGRFETRGVPIRREAWEDYVAFLRARHTPAAILGEHAADLDGLGESRARVEGALETTGSRLAQKSLVLTFDDGPHAKRTDQVLAILEKFGVKAVFFQVGQNVATGAREGTPTRASGAARRLVDAGHALGNHSFSHALLPKLSDSEIADQIERTNRALDVYSPSRVALFRPPYGARDRKVLAAVQARQMKSIMWNVDSRDWADPIPLSIANRVVRTVEGEKRGILLFHDIQPQTVEALPTILETLLARGYRFLSWNGSDFVGGQASVAAAAPPAEEPPAPLYGESWAVVIGIDAYKHWPRLSYAANDARGIRDLLVNRFAFRPDHVTVLLNEEATRARILEALGDRLSDPARVKKNDRVFVFFAGHGATRPLANGRALGYIIPVDADVSNYQSQAISMTNFQDISDAIPAKHVLFVTDACYGGLALTRGGAQSYLQQITRRTARQILTAGGADEQVADNGPNGHSIFTWTLMQALEGRGDLNGDGHVTASELAAYTGPIVSSLSRQTPAFGALPGSEGGEFVFQLSHETEFLSDVSAQLDEEAITLNAELDRLRKGIAEKRQRNEKLRAEVASARAEHGSAPATVAANRPPPPPTSAGANDRGMVLFREKRYAEALLAFEEAVRLEPANARAANNVGFTYFKMGRHAEAIQWFARTLKLDPDRAIAHANLGDACLALGRKDDARAAYETYLKLQPQGSYAGTVRTRLQRLL